MTENEPDIPELTGTPLGTTGKELREAREAKGWDISTLSESLHLRPAVLIAIEEGDYREVPELFLKGYVRSYARLVGLEGDRLIRQLESELQPLRQQEAENRVESPTFHIAVKKRKKRRVAFWVLLAAFFIVILFGLIRFQNLGYGLGFLPVAERGEEQADEPNKGSQQGSSLPDLEDVTDPAPRNIEMVGDDQAGEPNADGESPDSEVASLAEVLDMPSEPEPEPAAPLSQPESDAEVGADSGRGTAQADDEPASADATAQPDTGVEEPTAAGPDEEEGTGQVEADSIDVIAATPGSAAQPAPEADRVSFSIQFQADCWVEVRDATGDRVFAGLMTPGDQLSRAATAPVSFIIGNVDAIDSFTFDGEPVTVSEYPSRNDRAEITLDTNSGN